MQPLPSPERNPKLPALLSTSCPEIGYPAGGQWLWMGVFPLDLKVSQYLKVPFILQGTSMEQRLERIGWQGAPDPPLH